MRKLKSWFAVLLILAMMQSLSGCHAEGGLLSQPAASQEIDKWGLTLSAKKVTPTGLTLVITQAGGAPTGRLEYGSEFSLEKMDKGIWESVPYAGENFIWTAVAYFIPMENTVEQNIAWESIYGRLSAGTYRLCMDFMDFRDSGDYDTDTYYVVFELK